MESAISLLYMPIDNMIYEPKYINIGSLYIMQLIALHLHLFLFLLHQLLICAHLRPAHRVVLSIRFLLLAGAHPSLLFEMLVALEVISHSAQTEIRETPPNQRPCS